SRSLLDFEDGGAMVALGAALENAVLAAHHQGIAVRVDECPIPGEAKIVARLTLGAQVDGAEPAICDELYPMIGRRRTNRRLSRRTRIALADLATLARVAETVPGAKIQWLTEDEHLADCAAILGAGDRIRLLTEELSRHLMSEIRWTPAEAAATRDGISTEELGLASADVAALRICRDWSTLSLVRDWRGGAHFERIARRAIGSAGAVGLLTMPSPDRAHFLRGGRAVQRLWLAATRAHLALQPMTALPYLFARLTR